jgi:DNA-directed RNA polymerase subunit RPC12/RpoP
MNKYICGCCGDHISSVTWNEELERDECNNCKYEERR